jgi:hypothetical protein
MEESNVRYGVINDPQRTAYEKKWQVKAGYDYITYDSEDAENVCRKQQGRGWVVEKIYNIPNNAVNFRSIIFRG